MSAQRSTKLLSEKFYTAMKKLEPRYPNKVALLLPALHQAQEETHWLSSETMEEIAHYIGIHPAQVREVASFYTMYNLEPVGKHHLKICTNVACCLRGAYDLVEHCEKSLNIKCGENTADGRFSLHEEECLGACGTAPALMFNDHYLENVSKDDLDKILKDPDAADKAFVTAKPERSEASIAGKQSDPKSETLFIQHFHLDARPLSYYLEKMNGYQAAKKAFGMSQDAIIDEVKKSALRGRGGAGFPTGTKWGFIPKQSPKPKYLVCNADESEPGTFKDRDLMRFTPHLLIEGMVIGAFAIGARHGYIYIRGEYTKEAKILDQAIEEAYAKGYLGKNIMGSGFEFDLTVHRGAGAYICGEETGLLNSLEGKRGEPRVKPPFPAQSGAFGGPTIVNNVETLTAVPFIINRGGDWFAKLGKIEKSGGTRLFCVSGDVKRPGLYELPAGGVTIRQLIYDYCGGVLGDRPLKAVIPGGSSAPVLRADEIDVVLDIEPMMKVGTMLGSAGVMVINDQHNIIKIIRRITQFYAHESCGQCTPCREGCRWMEDVLHRIEHGHGKMEDLPLLLDIADNINGKTLCALGDAAAGPVSSFVRKFRADFEAVIKAGKAGVEKCLSA